MYINWWRPADDRKPRRSLEGLCHADGIRTANPRRVARALIYPAILVLSGVLAVATLFVFVVPKFANLLNETAQPRGLPGQCWSIGVWSNESSGLLAFAVLLLAGGIAVALRNPAPAPMRSTSWCACP